MASTDEVSSASIPTLKDEEKDSSNQSSDNVLNEPVHTSPDSSEDDDDSKGDTEEIPALEAINSDELTESDTETDDRFEKPKKESEENIESKTISEELAVTSETNETETLEGKETNETEKLEPKETEETKEISGEIETNETNETVETTATSETSESIEVKGRTDETNETVETVETTATSETSESIEAKGRTDETSETTETTSESIEAKGRTDETSETVETSQQTTTCETKDKDKFDDFKKPETSSSTMKPTEKDFGDYAKYVTYAEDGSAIYTDPKTKYQYKWSEKENNWISLSGDATASASASATATDGKDNPFENEYYKWCSETQSWKLKATQATETEHYKWDAEKNQWIPKQSCKEKSESNTYDVDEDGQRIYTDKDGVVYFWDETKNAWFPKIDDDFMARYQMNYGFIDNVSAGEEEKRNRDAEEAKRKAEELEEMEEEAREAMDAASSGSTTGLKRKTQEPPKWFEIDAAHNTKVYVTNLPLDITLDEFAELMGKCGMIMRDPLTQKFKLKLYTETDGQIKGDGLCDYIKVESVNLALNILDEYVYRGHKIRVQRAKFEMRGEYNPALKPKRKKKDKEKLLKMKERLFDWRPEKMRGERTKNEKVVIIKNLFTPDIFEKEVQLILDYQNDLREECSKCGTVRKVVIYDCHPEGIAQINMASPEEADVVIQMMQGRYFGKRQLSAEHWDGKTKYKVAESEKEAQERLSNWDEFLETDAEKPIEKT